MVLPLLERQAVALEWLILADAAQVVGNKLYLLGGGWDALTVQQPFPVDHPFAIALSFRVPWNETNQRHHFEFEIVTEDGKPVVKGGGDLEVGRPPGLPPGTDQRAQMAISAVAKIEKEGGYTIIGRIEGHEVRTSFRVIMRPRLGN